MKFKCKKDGTGITYFLTPCRGHSSAILHCPETILFRASYPAFLSSFPHASSPPPPFIYPIAMSEGFAMCKAPFRAWGWNSEENRPTPQTPEASVTMGTTQPRNKINEQM